MTLTVGLHTLEKVDPCDATPPTSPTDLTSAQALIASLRSEVEDLLAQRNAAEETVRRYAKQADIDRVTIQAWERLSLEWVKERAAFEARLWVLEKVARTAPPQVHLHIHVHQGGVVNVLGGGS
jgi:hypothetical protein